MARRRQSTICRYCHTHNVPEDLECIRTCEWCSTARMEMVAEVVPTGLGRWWLLWRWRHGVAPMWMSSLLNYHRLHNEVDRLVKLDRVLCKRCAGKAMPYVERAARLL